MANIRTPDPGLKLDLAGKTTYGDYLRLDRLLSAQETRSKPEHHDELLFIIQHQTSELWMKLLIHELTAARALVREDRLEPAFKILARAGQIQRMLFEQWSVLETLTPSEYLEFRSVPGPGQRVPVGAVPGARVPARQQGRAVRCWSIGRAPRCTPGSSGTCESRASTTSSSATSRAGGCPVPAGAAGPRLFEPYEPQPGVVAVFRTIYGEPEQWWDGYEMAEKLVDVEERFQLWRFRHMMTVHRIIGFKPGHGGQLRACPS